MVRADGKGRHYAVAHSETEANQKLAGLLTVEGSSLGLYEWADRYLELWVAAGKDQAQRRWVLQQFVKKWSELNPLHG